MPTTESPRRGLPRCVGPKVPWDHSVGSRVVVARANGGCCGSDAVDVTRISCRTHGWLRLLSVLGHEERPCGIRVKQRTTGHRSRTPPGFVRSRR